MNEMYTRIILLSIYLWIITSPMLEQFHIFKWEWQFLEGERERRKELAPQILNIIYALMN
jgi:hypothetical protein